MKEPADALARRKRSHMTIDEAHAACAAFARTVVRFGETSEASLFTNPSSSGQPAMGSGYINCQFMVRGSFGATTDIREAFRVFKGCKLPRKDSQ